MDRKVEIQKFLTKSGKINSRISPEKYQYLVDDYRRDAPWISDLKDILWCEKTGSYEQPVCRFCGKQAIYQRGEHSYRNYCSDCLNKHFSEERSKKGTWNKGLTKDTDDRVEKNASGVRKFRKTHGLSEAQKSVVDRMIKTSRIRDRTKEEFEKQRKTNKERYGVESYLTLVNKKGREVIKEKYGSAFIGSEEWKERKDEYFVKMRKTNLERYGVECILSSKDIQKEIQNTKRTNHSFKNSKTEKLSVKLIQSKIREVYIQYRDSRYPFACDIYLPKFDMFIELNYHWTHGSEPFIDSEHQRLVLQQWMEKAKCSLFYQNAIDTWTERDVRKRIYAEDNHLNYKMFYTYEGFSEFVEILETETILFPYRELSISPIPDNKDRFEIMLNAYKGYTSNLKFNDLLMPFIWKIFYKKELELWNDSDIRTKLIQNRISYLHKPEDELTDLDILRGFTISGIHKGFSSFSPMVIKNFIKDYTISSIYDPCGGWGHRLLGAWNIEYWYNDFNPDLVDAVRRVFCYYDNDSAKKYFSCNDASTFIPNRTFDAVFTCPPYYDTEDYDFEGDSKNLVQGYQQWLDIWWRGVVQRGKEVAPIFAYVISEKFADGMNRIVEEEGFHLIGSYQTSIKRKNHLNVSAEEFLYVFSLLT